MKTASLNDLKKEMTVLSQDELVNLCVKLARYKKENKELLNYLLFEAGDEERYIRGIKEEVEEEYINVNRSNLYFAKKTIRKILRLVKKYIKYSGKKETEVELLIFFCEKMKETKLPIKESKVLLNLYQRQIEIVKKALGTLHEDLQFDYQDRLDSLRL